MDTASPSTRDTPLRLLFLRTVNSTRSQIGEAILPRNGAGRITAGSAGSRPAARVNPLSVEVLHDFGIDWSDRTSKGIDAVMDQRWDLIITVCDQAREASPNFPSRPAFAYWGMPDPAAVVGSDEARRQAFGDTVQYLSRRIDLLLALPSEKLKRLAVVQQAHAIANQSPIPGRSAESAPSIR